MKKANVKSCVAQVFIVILLLAMSAITSLAIDKDLALAQRLEKEGNCAEAATYWEKMQAKSKSLADRVKYTLPVVKCKIGYERFVDVKSELKNFDLHSEDQGKSFVKALYPDLYRGVKYLAHKYPDLSIQNQAYDLLNYYLKHFPNERPRIAQELNSEGLTQLALMVDGNVVAKQCSGLLAKVQKATGTEKDLNNYAEYAKTCTGQPVSQSVCQQAFKSAEVSADPYTKLRFYSAGKMMGCEVSEDLQPTIIGIIRKFAKTPDAQGSKYNEDAANLGRTLLPVEVVEREVPERIIYYPGVKKTFFLEANEQIDHVIAFPQGRKTLMDFDESPESDYIRVYRDGTVLGMTGKYIGNNTEFRFQAKKKSKIWIYVHE